MKPSSSRYYVYIKPVIKNLYVRTYSSLIFSLIAVAFFSYFAISPTIKTILSLSKEIEQQKIVLEQLTEKTRNLDDATKNFQAIDEATKNKLDVLVPTKLAVAPFINDISDLASRNEASISGFQFQPFEIDNLAKEPSEASQVKDISFSMNLQGSYFSVVNTLNSFSKMSHIILIDALNITKNPLGGLVVTLTGRTIY